MRQQVADLTKELEKVKSGNSNNHDTPIVEQELPSTDSYSKNPFMASYRGQSKTESVKLTPRRHIKLHSRNHGYFKKLRRAVQSTKLLQDDTEGLIINLSSKSFTVYDFKFLNKGLNFCPTQGLYNSREFANDIKHFSRKIKLKAHFGTQTNTSENENEDFKPETDKTWGPQYTHHTVKTYLEGLEWDLNEVQPNTKRLTFHNLSKKERASLQKLQKMDDIIITKADKGGATVILDVKDYIAEAVRQLNDIHSYEKLDSDLTSTYNEIINNAIDNLLKVNELPEKVAQSLKNDKPKTPKFYTLPKIHKPNNPGRPVVNSIDSHTSRISKYVDFYLQPLARQLPSCIQDTSHFLRKLNIRRDSNPDSILVTLDVRSLYTNIPNEEGIAAVREAISMSTSSKISSNVITTFLWLILTLSNFVFNGINYLQKQGVTMGTINYLQKQGVTMGTINYLPKQGVTMGTINYLQKQGVTMGSICSPSYANIFRGYFEKMIKND